MPYYAVANLVTVTKTIMIDEMPCGYGTLRTMVWEYGTKSPGELVQRFQQLSMSPAELLQRSQQLSQPSTDLRRGLSSSKI
jgi:hypothetical protein